VEKMDFECQHTHTRIVKQIAANGAEQCFVECLECGHNVTESKTGKPGAFLRKPTNIDSLPIVRDYRTPEFVCEVCGAIGVEEHHWAPRFIFGEEADKWPVSRLCPKCHSLWHAKVTPFSHNLTKGDSNA